MLNFSVTQDTSVTPRDELPYAIEQKRACEIFWTRIAAYRGIFREQGDDTSAELRMSERFSLYVVVNITVGGLQ